MAVAEEADRELQAGSAAADDEDLAQVVPGSTCGRAGRAWRYFAESALVFGPV